MKTSLSHWINAGFAAGAIMLLSSCASLSFVHPPARNIDAYDACGAKIVFPDETTESGLISMGWAGLDWKTKLAISLARGTALSRDLHNNISPDIQTFDKSAGWIWGKDPGALQPTVPSPTMGSLRAIEQTPIQQFLDCYIDPVDPADYDTRLLRGHMALALLSKYTTSVVLDAAAAKRRGYATAALGMLSAAELSLAQASWTESTLAAAGNSKVTVINPGGDTPDMLRNTANAARVEQILTVAAYADSIAVRNVYGLVLTVVGEAASKMTPTTIAQDAASSALKGLESAFRYNNEFGAAFDDAKLDLQKLRDCGIDSDGKDVCSNDAMPENQTSPEKGALAKIYGYSGGTLTCTGTPAPGDRACTRHEKWVKWSKFISDACTQMSGAAGAATTNTCLPTDDQITAASLWTPAASSSAAAPALAATPKTWGKAQ